MKIRFAGLLLALLLLSGCSMSWENAHPGSLPRSIQEAATVEDTPSPAATPSPEDDAVIRVREVGDEAVDVKWGSATARLGLSLYSPLYKLSNTRNLCLSPVSLAWTFAQAAEGLAGKSREQIIRFLDMMDVPADWMQAFSHDSIAAYQSGVPGMRFTSADGVWVQEGLTVQDDFAQMSDLIFGGEIEAVPLKQSGVKTINAFLRGNTAGLAADAVTARKMSDQPIVALAGTATYHGAFQVPFDRQNTVSQAFRTAAGRDVRVPMMSYNGACMYYEGDDAQCVRLPMNDGNYALTLVLPRQERKDLLSDMDLTILRELWRHMELRRVDIRLPRFTLDARVELSDLLIKQGLTAPFDESAADLTPMLGKAKARIAGIWHGASITVDESFSPEAAEEPAWEIGISSPVSMHMTRPFFFTVDDLSSGAILMMGVVTDPRVIEER